MYVHGIINKKDDERLQGAIQYGGKNYLENDVLVVRKSYTTLQSELTYTVFERLRAGIDAPAIFGASNASREQAKVWGLLEEYNRNNPNAQARFARKVKENKSVEVSLDKMKTWEQARNQALKNVGDLGNDSLPIIGSLNVSKGYGKIVGRKSADGKRGWRLDYDPIKGIHINIYDFAKGKTPDKAIKQVIPFDEDEKTFETLLKQLNK
ncbi:hypothetical protein MHD_00015 [Mannheimia granulomatis]|uniref:Uncharacterized protein n=1 Tax=Mannheimia granulomatis TaxID=85402 RepID=A0A011NBN0_9PAST|nr:hypothetical protein [Mannheimia granulomatis]EXI61820.1 hypothetical protein AK33_06740 [Mannheimia granulomatis]RGE49229.1 hypothetical protein MHD_00015 [Mannheimia granulomatis]